ncbi:MAG TPA: class I SAM-dependent methyltransferase [Anaerolineales bacterium]|nr:class I SAM-dependent methyltransferase [Anaerolineales bacterium]
MSNKHRKIYQTDADRYEALVSREDHQGNIMRALEEIVDPSGLDVFDLGAGTGRLTLMLAPRVKSIRAFDISAEMLRVCRERLLASGLSNWDVDVADHRQLPVDDHSVDLVVSGWSVAYLYSWHPDTWQNELEKWLGEMKRVLRRGSFIVLFESLGTGNEMPIELDHLTGYYRWLDESGFQKKWIRTDYKFASVEETEELSRFFFGDELGDTVKKSKWTLLPECTGVWWLSM